MFPLRRCLLPAGFLAAVLVGTATADDVTDKQKKVAETNLKKAEVGKSAVVEAENLILATTLPEPRAKAVAESLQKTYKLARKGLQFDEKEEPWKGKLTVYYLPSGQDFKLFVRVVAGQRPEEGYLIAVRGDEPYVVSGSELPEKATDAEVAAEVGPVVAAGLLAARAGSNTPVPEWVRMGFGRAAAYRAEGPNGKRFQAYKTRAGAAVRGGGGRPPARLTEVWEGDRKDADVLATSLMDYMAFGPGAANFPKFLGGLRPDENGNAPTIPQALESAMWKPEALEAAWRKWVQAGMPAK